MHGSKGLKTMGERRGGGRFRKRGSWTPFEEDGPPCVDLIWRYLDPEKDIELDRWRDQGERDH
jgi:hypothetical protein